MHRFKRENMLLTGLWFRPTKPVANLFMSVFRDSLQKLYKGVTFALPKMNESVYIRGVVMCGTSDLTAKAQFLNMKQFNGKHGCQTCKIKGIDSKMSIFILLLIIFNCALLKNHSNLLSKLFPRKVTSLESKYLPN